MNQPPSPQTGRKGTCGHSLVDMRYQCIVHGE
jgi:hypothetical protein